MPGPLEARHKMPILARKSAGCFKDSWGFKLSAVCKGKVRGAFLVGLTAIGKLFDSADRDAEM